MNPLYTLALFFISILAAEPNYYTVLGVSSTASLSAIKKAYRALTKKFHPDVNPDPEANERFTKITEAYEVLSDANKRKAYDQGGIEAVKRDQRPQSDPTDFFNFFGFGGGHPSHTKDRADDSNLKLYVTLQQLYNGEAFHVAFKRPVLCVHAEDCVIPRKDCRGRGISKSTRQLAPGYYVEQQTQDSTCVAAGQGLTSGRCSKCPKGLTVIEETLLTGFVEPGMNEGDTIKFEGAGQQAIGLESGDLILTLFEEKEENKYIRDQWNHLHTQVYITLVEALTGFNTTIPHPSGEPIEVARDAVTVDGQTIRITGKGMPIRSNDGVSGYGDLFVKCHVRYPAVSQFSPKRARLLKEVFSGVDSWTHLNTPNAATPIT